MAAARPRLWFVLSGIVLAVILMTTGGLIAIMHYRRQTAALPDTVAAVTERVARHIMLPTNEQPALATVTDASKLNTPFLKHAHNGDKILIYQKNQLAIIYRPADDRLVSVGPVSIDEPPATAADNEGGGSSR